MNKQIKKLKAFSLVELILAIGVFATISSMLIFLVVDARKTLDNTQTRAKATNLVQEINNALILLKDQSWQNISTHADGTQKHIDIVDGEYQIIDGQGTYLDLTYYFTISNALRDLSGNLIDTGGDIDPHTRVIDITIIWNDSLGREQLLTQELYINDWNTYSFIDTFVEDFNLGIHNGTYVENIRDGEVSLETMLYSDWCKPDNSKTVFDIYGNGVASAISTYENSVIMGTGGNASGVPFIKTTVTDNFPAPPTVQQDTSFTSSDKTNGVFLLNESHALLATDTSGKQVMIMNILSPVQMTGYVSLESQAKANTVSANGNKGFVSERNNLILFDLSSTTGSRPIINSASLGGNKNKTLVTDLYVDDQYAYMTLSEHTNEFVIYEHTPTLRLVGQINLGDMNANALFISEDKTKAFIGTENNALDELFIVDITNKESTYSVISSLDLGGMSVNALVSIEDRIMIGGEGGQQYQVVDIETLTAPAVCGGLAINSTVYDISLMQTATSNFSLLTTGDSTNDLQIIRGGLGGGGSDGNGYLPTGEFISQIFDTGSPVSEYYIMVIDSQTDNGTALKIQLRTADTSDMAGSTWIGPDGTNASYYENSNVYNIADGLIGRYFQYKTILDSDIGLEFTPLLEQIVINYEK
jgi:type II secretory pathway pseudopilin PulG